MSDNEEYSIKRIFWPVIDEVEKFMNKIKNNMVGIYFYDDDDINFIKIKK